MGQIFTFLWEITGTYKKNTQNIKTLSTKYGDCLQVKIITLYINHNNP